MPQGLVCNHSSAEVVSEGVTKNSGIIEQFSQDIISVVITVGKRDVF